MVFPPGEVGQVIIKNSLFKGNGYILLTIAREEKGAK